MSTKHDNDEQPTSIAAAIVALLKTMPGVNAPADERAAWFDTKATVLDRIAANPNTTADDAVKAADMAKAARLSAHTIRNQEDQR